MWGLLHFFTNANVSNTFAVRFDSFYIMTAGMTPIFGLIIGESMKKVVFGILAFAVLAAGAIFVTAQISGSRHRDGMKDGRGGDRMGGMMFRGLDLTDDQKAKVKEIMSASRANVAPLMQQAHEGRKAINALGTDGTFDQAKAESLAGEQAAVMSKLIVERAKAKAQVFALLTDAQKTKAAELRQKFDEHGGGRGEGRNHGERPDSQ